MEGLEGLEGVDGALEQKVEWVTGWMGDTPETDMTTRAPAVLKIVWINLNKLQHN